MDQFVARMWYSLARMKESLSMFDRFSFGQLINSQLVKLDRPAAWLAKESGISQATISRYLSGQSPPRSPEYVNRIAKVLNLDEMQRNDLFDAAGFLFLEKQFSEDNISADFRLQSLAVKTPTGVQITGCFYENGSDHEEILNNIWELTVAFGIKSPSPSFFPSEDEPTSVIVREEQPSEDVYQRMVKAIIGPDYCVYLLFLSSYDNEYFAPLNAIAADLQQVKLGPIFTKLKIEFDIQVYVGRNVVNASLKEIPFGLFAEEGYPSAVSCFQALPTPLICAAWPHLNRYVLIPASSTLIIKDNQDKVISQILDDLARLEIYRHKLQLNYDYYRQHYNTIKELENRINQQIGEIRKNLKTATVTDLQQKLDHCNEQLVDVSRLVYAAERSNDTTNANYINLKQQLESWNETPITNYPILSKLFLPEADQIVAAFAQFPKRITGLRTTLEDLIRAIHVRLERGQQQATIESSPNNRDETSSNSQNDQPLQVGSFLSGERYEITQVVYNMGNSRVYKGIDHHVAKQEVAIKEPVFFYKNLPEEEFVRLQKRYQREVKILAKLDHAYIAKVYDFIANRYMIQSWVEGVSLRKIIEEKKELPIERIVEIGVQACQALGYAYTRGAVIHRDIKPEHVFICDDGNIRIIDFGLALAKNLSSISYSPYAEAEIGQGTLLYMAPEQAHREGEPQADIFSLGVTLYELLTGRHPYPRGAWLPALYTNVVIPDPLPIHNLRSDIPRTLEICIFKAMDLTPENRYATWQDFENTLKKVLK
ncbi:MAG: protein kinase [Anaerolineae bacterium]|nr:protein kinase [Anaerolineae bacterium]